MELIFQSLVKRIRDDLENQINELRNETRNLEHQFHSDLEDIRQQLAHESEIISENVEKLDNIEEVIGNIQEKFQDLYDTGIEV